ncbi:MAG: hypothetical protein CVV07_03345 [Gammaproteobacteria bacterium HGW-Gammaproteobacteria-11]|nr:MAG: hypothetical protein CVV07_03345 [Gammaproteobacteria bacterium HGW-Gammaproteobacteria-11]
MIDSLPAASESVRPSARNEDLRDNLRRAMAEDIDFQILRRTLNAEAAAEPTGTATSTSTEAAEVATPQPVDAPVDAVAQVITMVEQRELSLRVEINSTPQVTDPLVLDMAGNGFRTSGINAGVRFDLNGDGRQQQISVPLGDDALLALDRNANGRIDDGRELFGDQHGAAHGFAELARYDDNADGVIDRQDAVFSELQLLRFSRSGEQQLSRLADAGITSIALGYEHTNIALNTYDRIAQLGSFTLEDGQQREAADLLLAGI